MTLETDLRATLHERASEIPASTTARLAAIDYRPRTRRLRTRPVAFGSLVGAAGTTAVVLSLTGGASTAFAGWSRTPTRPDPGALASASVDCAHQSPIAGLPLKLTDTRGPYTFEIYATDRQSAVCMTGPSVQSVSAAGSSAPITVPADRLQAQIQRQVNRSGDAFTFADGQVGADVSAATLTLDDGSQVTATVQNGWFVAWWPNGVQAKSATLTTSSGTQTQTLADTSPPCPAGAVCHISGSATSAAGGRDGQRSSQVTLSGSMP